jgi:hypothetical protein
VSTGRRLTRGPFANELVSSATGRDHGSRHRHQWPTAASRLKRSRPCGGCFDGLPAVLLLAVALRMRARSESRPRFTSHVTYPLCATTRSRRSSSCPADNSGAIAPPGLTSAICSIAIPHPSARARWPGEDLRTEATAAMLRRVPTLAGSVANEMLGLRAGVSTNWFSVWTQQHVPGVGFLDLVLDDGSAEPAAYSASAGLTHLRSAPSLEDTWTLPGVSRGKRSQQPERPAWREGKALTCLVGACVRCDHGRCDVECLSSAAGSC